MKSLTLIRGAVLSGALTLSYPVAALAASGGESTPLNVPSGSKTAHSSGGAGSSLIRTIVGLFIVIAVIYGISWLLRMHKGGKTRASGDGLASIASLPLGTGRSVALVRVGRELVLLGVAEQGVTAIRTYTEKEALTSGLELDPDQSDGDGNHASPPPLVRAVDAVRRMTERT
jgi:flagellar protein FliO/FliZ